jgi:hypothetical protein
MPRHHPAALIVLGLAAFASPTIVHACCPSGGNTSPKAASGLGEEYPVAADLAADPNWGVYQFQRDGIDYVQVNDSTGTVRAVVGKIADTAWVLPLGTDVDRVSTTPTAGGTVVYSGEGIEVRRYPTVTGDAWSIVPIGR